MADMAEDAKEDFVTAEEIEQSEGTESETAEARAESEPKVETAVETKAAVEAKPASLEKERLEINIGDGPKGEDAQAPVEIKSQKPKANAVEKPVQTSNVDAAREKVIAKIAETLDEDAQAVKQQADAAVEAKKPADAKAPDRHGLQASEKTAACPRRYPHAEKEGLLRPPFRQVSREKRSQRKF